MRAVIAVVLASLLFATTGTAQALAEAGGSATAVGAARILVGGALLAALELARRRRSGPAVALPAAHRVVPAWAVVAIGAAAVVAYQPCFFAGTRANGVAVGTVLALGFAPVATGTVATALGLGRPTRSWLLATGLALGGVVLLSGVVGGGSVDAVRPSGVLASLGAGLSYAVYTLAAKALLDRGWSPSGTMTWLFGLAAAISLPVLLVAGAGWMLSWRGALLALWLGVATTAVAYLLFGWGLARLPAGQVSTLTLAEPCGATALGVVVLGERLGAPELAGMALLVCALTLLAASRG